MRVFETFYTKHGQQAALPHQYPGAALVKDALAAARYEAGYGGPPPPKPQAKLASRVLWGPRGCKFGRPRSEAESASLDSIYSYIIAVKQACLKK